MPTRATQLAVSTPVANTRTLVFTCPAGTTYIVKSIVGSDLGAGMDTAYVAFVSALGPEIRVPYFPGTFNPGWTDLNEGIVLVPGDTIITFSLNGISGFWISGTKLPGVA